MESPSKQVLLDLSPFKTGLAFRPFFWLGSVYLILALLVWLSFWRGNAPLQPLGGMVWWHQHEMLFGFVCAIVAGFLLTAVQTWTGLASLKGPALGGVVVLWLAARIVLAFPMGLDPVWPMILDVAFLPVVALVLANLVVRAKKWRNLVFVPVLLVLTGANFAMHWGQMHAIPQLVQASAHLTIWLIVSLIVLLGGRVIPFFTSRALNLNLAPVPNYYEKPAIISTLLLSVLMLVQVLGGSSPTWLLSLLLCGLIISNTARLVSWQPLRCWRHPLLWGLHLSYGFIIVGAVLWLLHIWQIVALDFAVHALTIGSMLAIILAMMARVSLGHTGRPMKALPGLSAALLCVFVAAVIRSLLPIWWPQWSLNAYQLSLALCLLAFSWFLIHYTVPLWSARVDQRPG
ncbi:NnrS family protein [Paenalcaligenes hominis]|uniref:NnrS family protein n=1 Tax=Paenalcaligenes hominis TaxID=643674 RepID=UPI0035239B4B